MSREANQGPKSEGRLSRLRSRLRSRFFRRRRGGADLVQPLQNEGRGSEVEAWASGRSGATVIREGDQTGESGNENKVVMLGSKRDVDSISPESLESNASFSDDLITVPGQGSGSGGAARDRASLPMEMGASSNTHIDSSTASNGAASLEEDPYAEIDEVMSRPSVSAGPPIDVPRGRQVSDYAEIDEVMSSTGVSVDSAIGVPSGRQVSDYAEIDNLDGGVLSEESHTDGPGDDASAEVPQPNGPQITYEDDDVGGDSMGDSRDEYGYSIYSSVNGAREEVPNQAPPSLPPRSVDGLKLIQDYKNTITAVNVNNNIHDLETVVQSELMSLGLGTINTPNGAGKRNRNLEQAKQQDSQFAEVIDKAGNLLGLISEVTLPMNFSKEELGDFYDKVDRCNWATKEFNSKVEGYLEGKNFRHSSIRVSDSKGNEIPKPWQSDNSSDPILNAKYLVSAFCNKVTGPSSSPGPRPDKGFDVGDMFEGKAIEQVSQL